MTTNWSKEDRAAWSNSEVAQELEKKVLSAIESLDNILKKSGSLESLENLPDPSEVRNVNNAVKELAMTVENLSDDAEVVEFQENSDDGDKDDAEEPSSLEVVARLRELLKEATDNKEIELAYRIERTIDEILEEE
tara:strand:+ start:731 stop:1138 length:408 start_codon:yes stop_codon:yes gene_type:complete